MFAGFNIFGLTIGFTTFILIALLVQYEYGYDKHHVNLERIYRVEEMAHVADGDQFWNQTCYPVASRFKTEFPEVEDAVVTRPVWGEYLSTSEKLTFHEEDGQYVQQSFFDVFTTEFIEGSPEDALVEPYSIVLTESLREKSACQTPNVFSTTPELDAQMPSTAAALMIRSIDQDHLFHNSARFTASRVSEYGIVCKIVVKRAASP